MAELSPELAARVQSLEVSYADNPGRYFVALAGAWREGGDVARAEEILREGLKRFPGLSAHVLLGRCLADRGAFQEAANEFHYVLSIDSQNLIALRTLAEMAAAGGRRDEAERWYNELLAVDPMNVEARAALAQLARAAAAAPPAPAVETGGFGLVDLDASSPADASGAAADSIGEWGDLSLDLPEETPASASTPAPAEDFDAFGFGSVDLDGGLEDTLPAPSGGSAEWVDLDARQDPAEAASTSPRDADALPALDDDLLDAPMAGTELPLLSLDDDAPSAAPSNDAFDFGDSSSSSFYLGADDAAEADPSADGDGVDAEMVTETMAELYASQGLLTQAADVYRELIGRRGEEAGLVRRLAEIQAQLAPPAVPSTPATEPESVELGSMETAAADTPDWLESVDAFSRGDDRAPVTDFAAVDIADLDLSTPEEAAAEAPVAILDELEETAAVEPAPAEDALDPFVLPPAEGESAPAPTGDADAPVSADPFADSFANGFGGGEAEEGRQAWSAPSVTETEPVGFDILVVADEDGGEVPAPPEVVAEVSADWAIAAAPLGEDEDAEEAASAAPSIAAGTRTMAGYLSSLLTWQPGASAAAASANPAPGVEAEAAPPAYVPAAPEIPTFDAPAFQAPAFGGLEPEGPAPTDAAPAEPVEDEPWAAVPESTPSESSPQAQAEAEDDLPLLDLEQPWADEPATVGGQPVDIGAFTLEEAPSAPADAGSEDLLPWEMPAEPAPSSAEAAAPSASAAGDGFSFEDFFAGPTSAPAAPVEEPEPPAPPAEAEPAPFIPSFAEPTPPPVFAAPTPAPPAPAAAPAAEAQDEGDEDLESFQAWLQSLKR